MCRHRERNKHKLLFCDLRQVQVRAATRFPGRGARQGRRSSLPPCRLCHVLLLLAVEDASDRPTPGRAVTDAPETAPRIALLLPD